MQFIPWLLATFFLLFGSTECGITSQWDECGCRWMEWEAWGTCDSKCNGERSRSRKVWSYTHTPGCVWAFSTCASNDMGDDYSRCNTFCYNGGTSDSYSCSCVTGFYGDCCGFQVNCGNPGIISNGKLNGGTFTYGSTVRYTCHSGYLLVGGSSRRKCRLVALWSGTKPRCASKPCPTINVPVNGALICNDWRTDYGQFCTFFCKESYTVPRGVIMDDFYVCGASGTWMPSNTIPNCSVTATNLHATGGYSIGPTYSNCSDDRRGMQELYIKKLSQSDFRHFCKKFQQECIPENVSVQC
ncbi:CSMD [Mytilus coruscus]|uniref:CSMD n=1 Tax=Mytilus coruscus TaxID=42192 RepID=A0A6J8A708_MYTCO|nr:CSMD [Mytilus coruscus]